MAHMKRYVLPAPKELKYASLPMNTTKKTLTRMRFKTATARAMGMEFQNIFTGMVSYSSTAVSPAKPQ